MNLKRLTYIFLFALIALPTAILFSCSQEFLVEEGVMEGVMEEDDRIIFHTSLPGVETRSYDNIDAGNLVGGFSVSVMNLDSLINEDLSKVAKPTGTYKYEGQYNKIDLCMQNVPVERTPGMGDAFRGDGCRWPKAKDGKEGLLQFFAYYPSLETMRAKAGLDPNSTTYFNVLHPQNNTRSELRDTGYWFNYRMGNFLINKNISDHADFVAASTRGSKTNNLYSGVELKYEHKLSKVDLKAYGNNSSFDIEIAGVRIGGVITMSTYNLAGNWIHNTNGIVWDCVEYIYREGDEVVTIGRGNHDSANKSISIMGKGGYALMIPHKPSNIASGYPFRWNYTGNPTNTNSSNANVKGGNAGMYFSVLMRVIDKTDNQGLILYPYKDGALIAGTTTASNKNSVYLVVEKATGKVMQRVYKNKTTKQYFSDTALKVLYTAPEGLEIREYGWAAIPVVATFTINCQYTYTLNYSNGIGYHAPDDDAPGKPIITSLSIVGVEEDKNKWVNPYENEEIELKEGDFTQE